MLLIIFLGLMANLAAVSSDCDIGNHVNNFDFSKFSGSKPWFLRLHTSNAFDSNIDCPVAIYSNPKGNISLVTYFVYVISKQSYEIIYGNTTNWNSTGWDEIYQESSLSGRAYVIAVDYDRYIIVEFCYSESNQLTVFVAYRSQDPDKETVERVQKELKKNNLDVSQFIEWPYTHCQHPEYSTERGCSA